MLVLSPIIGFAWIFEAQKQRQQQLKQQQLKEQQIRQQQLKQQQKEIRNWAMKRSRKRDDVKTILYVRAAYFVRGTAGWFV